MTPHLLRREAVLHKFLADAEVGRKERGHEMKGPPPIPRRFAVAGVSSRFAGARGFSSGRLRVFFVALPA